jgi:hypothetical protein
MAAVRTDKYDHVCQFYEETTKRNQAEKAAKAAQTRSTSRSTSRSRERKPREVVHPPQPERETPTGTEEQWLPNEPPALALSTPGEASLFPNLFPEQGKKRNKLNLKAAERKAPPEAPEGKSPTKPLSPSHKKSEKQKKKSPPPEPSLSSYKKAEKPKKKSPSGESLERKQDTRPKRRPSESRDSGAAESLDSTMEEKRPRLDNFAQAIDDKYSSQSEFNKALKGLQAHKDRLKSPVERMKGKLKSLAEAYKNYVSGQGTRPPPPQEELVSLAVNLRQIREDWEP